MRFPLQDIKGILDTLRTRLSSLSDTKVIFLFQNLKKEVIPNLCIDIAQRSSSATLSFSCESRKSREW